MDQNKWALITECAQGARPSATPVALIVDSPWIPGFLGLSTLDYLTLPDVWLEANLTVERAFPTAIFLPGFWVEIGMAAEPSAFGCKLSFYPDKTPAVHALINSPEELDRLVGLPQPNPNTDGLMPMVINWYRRLEPRVRAAGHEIKVVAARGPLTVAAHLMGVTNFLLGLKLNPAATHRLLHMTTALVRDWLDAQANALPSVAGILVLDDVAGFLSVKDYLAFAHPYLKAVFDAFPNCVRIFHNDTDNPASYRYVSELGAQIFNFTHLQPLAKVRDLVGPSLCLMGNVAPLDVLVRETPEAVALAARDCLSSHANRPGLILSAGGGTSPGTPAANLHALINAARPNQE
jgi:uroporphyrinogen-III decarboxylase